jgi:hypothetical protein
MTNAAFIRAQATAIKGALRDGRDVEPFGVRVDTRDGLRTVIVWARSDRGAASVAAKLGEVRVTRPAHIRDAAAAIAAALRAADALPSKGGARAARERDTAGVRPARPAAPARRPLVVFRWLPVATQCPARVCAGVRTRVTAQPRHKWMGAPIAGQTTRPDTGVRLAHEYRAA